MRMTLIVTIMTLGPAAWAWGQSSSLYKRHVSRKAASQAATTQPANGSLPAGLPASAASASGERNTALAAASLTAIKVPEPKLLQVNDLVGVIIRYRLKSQSRAKMTQESEWDLNAKLSAWFRLHDGKLTNQGFRAGRPEVKFKTENEMENKGKSDWKDILETRVMSKIIDVKPNGNLVLVAWQTKGMNDDLQYLRFSGECNRDHITPDGNIMSDKVFALDVRIMSEGEVRDAVKRGWFKEFLDRVKPF